MYEYIEKSNKMREKIVLAVSLILGGISFGFSMLPAVLYPMLYQLLAVICFVVSVFVATRYLMRDFVYRVSPREDAESSLPDFTVTEIYGRKKTVVCRVSVGDILSVEKMTKETKADIRKRQRKKSVYVYVGEMNPAQSYVLTVADGEDEYFLQICADEKLLSLLQIR